jgi:hypothetical protein
VVEEAAAAVEFEGGVAVGDFKVEEFGVVFAGGGFGEIEKLGANSLSAMGGFDEEFVDPCAFAAIFEAVVETDHEISHWLEFFADDVNDTTRGIRKKLGKTGVQCRLVKRLRPRIGLLHVAHQEEQRFEICESGASDGDWHETRSRLRKKIKFTRRMILRRENWR